MTADTQIMNVYKGSVTLKKAGVLIERGNALNPGIDRVASSLPAVNRMKE